MGKSEDKEKKEKLQGEVKELEAKLKKIETAVKDLKVEKLNCTSLIKSNAKLPVKDDFIGNKSKIFKTKDVTELKTEMDNYNIKLITAIETLETKAKSMSSSIDSINGEISAL